MSRPNQEIRSDVIVTSGVNGLVLIGHLSVVTGEPHHFVLCHSIESIYSRALCLFLNPKCLITYQLSILQVIIFLPNVFNTFLYNLYFVSVRSNLPKS